MMKHQQKCPLHQNLRLDNPFEYIRDCRVPCSRLKDDGFVPTWLKKGSAGFTRSDLVCIPEPPYYVDKAECVCIAGHSLRPRNCPDLANSLAPKPPHAVRSLEGEEGKG